MSLILYKTNFKQLDGEGPEYIDLTRATTTIGRGSQTLNVDATVYARKNGADIISRRHAAVSRSATNQFVLSDLGAINGTFINLVKISSQVLKDGDIVQLGGITSLSKEPDGFCVKYLFREKGILNSYTKDSVTTGADGSNAKSVQKASKTKRNTDNSFIAVPAMDSNPKKKVRIKVQLGGDENDASTRRNNQALATSVHLNASTTDSHLDITKCGINSSSRERDPRDQKLVAEVAELRFQMEELKRIHAESLAQVTVAAAPGGATSASVSILSSDSQSKKAASLSSSCSSTDSSRRSSTKGHKSDRDREKGSVIETVEHISSLTASNRASETKGTRNMLIESNAKHELSSCQPEHSNLCSIDISSLRCNLICAICSLPLLDAVVVPCSHGVSNGFLSSPPTLSSFISHLSSLSILSSLFIAFFVPPIPHLFSSFLTLCTFSFAGRALKKVSEKTNVCVPFATICPARQEVF